MPADDCCTLTFSGDPDLENLYLPDETLIKMEPRYNMQCLPPGWTVRYSDQRKELYAVKNGINRTLIRLSNCEDLWDVKMAGIVMAHFFNNFTTPDDQQS